MTDPAPGSGSPLDSPWARALAPWIVGVLTILAFENAAPDTLVFDDNAFLPLPRGKDESAWDVVGRLFVANVWPARRLNIAAYRPLTFATLLLDDVASGGHRWAFHVSSIALHVAATVLLYFVLRRLLEGGAALHTAPRAWIPAAVASAVFGVHPIHTEAVDSAFNRGEMLVTLCVLGAVAVVVHFRRTATPRDWAIAGALYLVALLCKENAAVLPVLLVTLLVCLRAEGPLRERLRSAAPALWLLVPHALFVSMRTFALRHSTFGYDQVIAGADALALTLTGFRDLLAMVLFPHPFRAVRTETVARAVPVAVVVIVAYGAALHVAYRRNPGVAAGLAFFAVATLPSLPAVTALANAQPLAERYAYLPSVGLSVALAFGLAALARRWREPPVLALGALVMTVFIPMTRGRNEAWHSEVALFEPELALAPENTDVLLDLASAYTSAGRPDDTLALCQKAADDGRAAVERLFSICARILDARGRTDEAEAYFLRGIGGDAPPSDYIVYARFLIARKRPAEAERLYEQAIGFERDPVRQHADRAEMLLKLHGDRLDEALTEIDAALATDPAYEIAINLRERIIAALTSHPPPVAPGDTSGFDAAALDAMVEVLRTARAGSPAWIRFRSGDAGAAARAEALAAAFTRAGWMVRSLASTNISVRPGLFIYGADDDPPDYVQTASRALTRANLAPSFATGYRAYFEESTRSRPGFQGFELAPEQTFVIVVGRTL